MVVASDERLDVKFPEGIGHLVPVVEVALEHGVVGCNEHLLALAVLAHLVADPTDVLRCHMAQRHLDERARCEAEEEGALVLKLHALAAEQLAKLCHARLAPRRFVVAREHIIFLVQGLQGLGKLLQRGVVAVVETTNNQKIMIKVDVGVLVDVGNGHVEILQRLRVVAVEVDVGDLCKGERLLCPALNDGEDGERDCQ